MQASFQNEFIKKFIKNPLLSSKPHACVRIKTIIGPRPRFDLALTFIVQKNQW